MTTNGTRNPDLLTLSRKPYPLGHILNPNGSDKGVHCDRTYSSIIIRCVFVLLSDSYDGFVQYVLIFKVLQSSEYFDWLLFCGNNR